MRIIITLIPLVQPYESECGLKSFEIAVISCPCILYMKYEYKYTTHLDLTLIQSQRPHFIIFKFQSQRPHYIIKYTNKQNVMGFKRVYYVARYSLIRFPIG